MAASADEGEEDLEPGFSSDEYEEGTTSSAAPEHVHGNSPQLAPEQRQRIELQKRRAIALRWGVHVLPCLGMVVAVLQWIGAGSHYSIL